MSLSKGLTPDSSLADVLADCNGSEKPDSICLMSFRGVGGELLRSEQMSSRSSSSAGPGSRLLLKVWFILAMALPANILVLILSSSFLGIP